MSLLSLEDVAMRYRRGRRETAVFEGAWLEVNPGDVVGVWGPRRAGKTTLLRVAAGIEEPDSGTVRFRGVNIAEMSRSEHARLLRAEIGFAPSGSPRGRSDLVLEHVLLPLLGDGWRLDDASVKARTALRRVGASELADSGTLELSPGEHTRVAIARALVRNPSLLLVDEPALTPSPSERDQIRDLLGSLAVGSEMAIIIASEEVSVLRNAPRVVSLSDGRLLSSERSGTVLEFPSGRGMSERRAT